LKAQTGADVRELVSSAQLGAGNGVVPRWRTDCVTVEQDAAGVTALLRDRSGAETRVRATYVIGADGSEPTYCE